MDRGVGSPGKFRWRGTEVSRIEALSDAVFGFAITLLVVSLEVPRTFAELQEVMRGFVPFAASFAMLVLLWYQQYVFFRRYGLQDTATIVLNAVLLFVVVFYVYPLKFLWGTLINQLLGRGVGVRLATGEVVPAVTESQWPALMKIFGLGYAAVFLVFALLYLRAWARRRDLGLTRLEVFDTWTEFQSNLINVLIGALSVSVVSAVISARSAALSGWVYCLVGPALTAHGFMRGARRKRLLGRTPADGDPADAPSAAGG